VRETRRPTGAWQQDYFRAYHRSQLEAATKDNFPATETVALLRWPLRFDLCVVGARRTIEPAPFEQWLDVGIAPDEILK
jgi:hypothetical protein